MSAKLKKSFRVLFFSSWLLRLDKLNLVCQIWMHIWEWNIIWAWLAIAKLWWFFFALRKKRASNQIYRRTFGRPRHQSIAIAFSLLLFWLLLLYGIHWQRTWWKRKTFREAHKEKWFDSFLVFIFFSSIFFLLSAVRCSILPRLLDVYVQFHFEIQHVARFSAWYFLIFTHALASPSLNAPFHSECCSGGDGRQWSLAVALARYVYITCMCV